MTISGTAPGGNGRRTKKEIEEGAERPRAEPPVLETPLPLPAGCPHLLGRRGGRCELCWVVRGAGRPRRRWDPQRHTAATALRAAQRWVLAFLVWQAVGAWPVPDAWEALS